MRGYAIVDDLRKMGVPVHELVSSESGLRMLLAGRVDGFAQLTEVGEPLLRKYPAFSAVVRQGPPLTTRDYYLQISHPFQARHPDLPAQIWKALAEVRRTSQERLSAKSMRLYGDEQADAGSGGLKPR